MHRCAEIICDNVISRGAAKFFSLVWNLQNAVEETIEENGLSINKSELLTMQWRGFRKEKKPLHNLTIKTINVFWVFIWQTCLHKYVYTVFEVQFQMYFRN